MPSAARPAADAGGARRDRAQSWRVPAADRLDPLAEQRRLRRRPADDPHVRADAARRDPRRDLADEPSAGRSVGGDPDLVLRVAVWGVGVRRRRRARSTTSSPRGTRCRPRSGRASSRSGTAASASGAGSCFGTLVGCDRRRRSGASARRCSWTRSRRACCSRRGSAGSATGGTRSCTASRRPAVGPRDRPGPPHRCSTSAHADLPPDVPLRADLGPRRRRCS